MKNALLPFTFPGLPRVAHRVAMVALLAVFATGCAKTVDPAPDYPVDDEYFQTVDFEFEFPELATAGGEEAPLVVSDESTTDAE